MTITEQKCGCGQPAVIELRFPAVERYRGSGEVWQPFCQTCYEQHIENAAAVTEHEMRNFGGAYGIPEWEERPVKTQTIASSPNADS